MVSERTMKAIEEYGTAQWSFGGGRYNEVAIVECQRTKVALLAAIEAEVEAARREEGQRWIDGFIEP